MIAETTIVLYNSESKKVIAEVKAGLEYHSSAEIFEGTLEEFMNQNPDYDGNV